MYSEQVCRESIRVVKIAADRAAGSTGKAFGPMGL